MKTFFDLRLGYFVSLPGSGQSLDSLQGKAGDDEELIIQFGRSADPTASTSLISSAVWTPENLIGGSVITAAIKLENEYSDGELLASNSTWVNDPVEMTYTGGFNLNTIAINAALKRLTADSEDDVATLECGFEVTIQPGGVGGWRSSILPVSFTIYHDLIAGGEDTPVNASDPDEYLLKASAIEYLPTVTSKVGGTATDFDAVVTVGVTVGKAVQFLDADGASDLLRKYWLTSGTDAESLPDVIRPDDYDAVTNAKVWKLLQIQDGMTAVIDDPTPQLGGNLDTNGSNIAVDTGKGIIDENGNEQIIFETTESAVNYIGVKNASTANGPTVAAQGDDANIDLSVGAKGTGSINVSSPIKTTKIIKAAKGASVASAASLVVGDDGNYFDVTGTTTITSIASKGIGAEIKLRFTGVLTLTHNAVDLILPGGENIITASGDVAEFTEYASGDWRCTNYQKASGRAITEPISSSNTAIWISAKEMKASATSGAAAGSTETAAYKWNFDTFDFDTSSNEYVNFTLTMPSNWNLGAMTAKFYWTAATGSGTVKWAIRAVSLSDASTLDRAPTSTGDVTDTLTTALYMHITDASSSFSASGTTAAGTPMLFNVARAVSGDTLGVDAKLIGCELTFGTV